MESRLCRSQKQLLPYLKDSSIEDVFSLVAELNVIYRLLAHILYCDFCGYNCDLSGYIDLHVIQYLLRCC